MTNVPHTQTIGKKKEHSHLEAEQSWTNEMTVPRAKQSFHMEIYG
jgi:hypothetical protein